MKRLLPLLLLALTCHVYAQSPQPGCWPKSIGGKGTWPVWSASGDGAYLGWWCPLADGTWKSHGVVAVPGYEVKHPPGPFSSMADEAAAYWALNVTGSIDANNIGQHYTWIALQQALAAARPPAAPATAWVVAASTLGSRPLYSIVDSALVLATGRATSGQACDCSVTKLVRTTTTYCVPAGQTVLVTLCSPKAP